MPKARKITQQFLIYAQAKEVRDFERAMREQGIIKSRSGMIKLLMRRFVNGWNKKKSRAKAIEKAKFDKLARDGATGLLD